MSNAIPVPCPSCGAKTPPDSQFCPQCGAGLTHGETLEMNPGPILADPSIIPGAAPVADPPTVHVAHRRPLGAHPVPLLAGLGALTLLLAIVLLSAGSWVAGLILLGLATASFTLLGGGVRREPDAPGARIVLGAAGRVSSLARLAAVAVRAWSRAIPELIRIRGRQERLRIQLRSSLAPLGSAVQRDDQQQARALKRRAVEIDQQLKQAERDASAVLAEARQQIDRERATIEPTEVLAGSLSSDGT